MQAEKSQSAWASSCPDAIAFVFGLAVARALGWATTDLVWSLWLSSLVVGYSTIVWMIARPTFSVMKSGWRARADLPSLLIGWFVMLVGAAGFLAFFTLHFGGFHYLHSKFLMFFFPIDTGNGVRHTTDVTMSTYREVMRRYWVFLPSVFLAHRSAFQKPALSFSANDWSSGGPRFRDGLLEPYANVVRLHILIFFFFFAHAARLENFTVYAICYAAYFFPWRLVLRRPPDEPLLTLQ
jgi:hypothetical protein